MRTGCRLKTRGQNRVGYFGHDHCWWQRRGAAAGVTASRSGQSWWKCGWRMWMSPSNRLDASDLPFPTGARSLHSVEYPEPFAGIYRMVNLVRGDHKRQLAHIKVDYAPFIHDPGIH